MQPQTILIGLDGATFTILDPLLASGHMPFLAAFIESGVRAECATVIPALTPPAWTSLVTGVGPGQHGIFDFFRKETSHSHNFRFLTARDVQAETIWSLANQHDLRAIALNFPLTFPAPKIEGYVVPGWMPWRQLRLGCHPRALYGRLQKLPGFDPHDLGMDMSQEAKALEGCDPEEYAAWIEWHIRREQQWFQILAMLLQEEATCGLVTILFDGVDKLQHLCWRFIDPAYKATWQSPWEKQIHQACLHYFQQLDEILGKIIALGQPNATIIMASDHGFGPQQRTFFVNGWLAQRGYLSWADANVPIASDQQHLGVGQISRHGYLLDWQQTQAYAPLPSGNGIHIVLADDEHPGGVSPAQYEAFREQLIGDLLQVQDPISGEAVVSKVWRREEIFEGTMMALAPDLTLVLADGGLISILDAEQVVQPRPYPSGTHSPHGIFLARGPGLRQSACLPEQSILDIAPLVLHSLGLPIPTSMKGVVPLAVYEADYRQTHPVRQISNIDATSFNQEIVADELDDEMKTAVLGRLRALGYLE